MARRLPPAFGTPGADIRQSPYDGGVIPVMSESHPDVIAATRACIGASGELREVLASVEEGLPKGIGVLDNGGSPMDHIRTPRTRRQRTTMQTALDQFTDARNRYRTPMRAECVNDGMKAREPGDLRGSWRQRASLLIQEVRRVASEDVADGPEVAHSR